MVSILLREFTSPLIKMTRIIIKASDVSAIVGKNNFKSRDEVFNDMWKKYSPENFNSKTKLDLAEESLAKSDTAKEVLQVASKKRARDSDEVQKNFKEAEAKINSDPKLNKEDKKKVVEHLKSTVFTNHGTLKEDETARRTGLDLGRDLKFHQIHVGTYNDRDYVVVGRVDRIETLEDGTKVLVEIKNRTRCLFKKVYPSEMVQIQVYLEMLGLTKAKLVEQFNKEINTIEVDRDEDMFKEIIKNLEDFCFEFSQVIV